MIVDATNAIAGRLAAFAAKQALLGETVQIINAEKTVFSGSSLKTVEKYSKRRTIQQKANPEHSAKWPRRPDYLLKKIIKGMLPKKTSRGKLALKKVTAFIGVPKELSGKPVEKIALRELRGKKISLEQLCKKLGWSA